MLPPFLLCLTHSSSPFSLSSRKMWTLPGRPRHSSLTFLLHSARAILSMFPKCDTGLLFCCTVSSLKIGTLLLIFLSRSFSPLLGTWMSCDKCCWMTGWMNPHDDSLPLYQLRTFEYEGWKEPHGSYGSISSFQR